MREVQVLLLSCAQTCSRGIGSVPKTSDHPLDQLSAHEQQELVPRLFSRLPHPPGHWLMRRGTLRNRWATSLNCMQVWQSTDLKLKGTKTRVFGGTNANDPQLALRSGLPSTWGHWPVLVTLNVGLGDQHSTFARDTRGWKFQLHVGKGRTGEHRLLQLSGINM